VVFVVDEYPVGAFRSDCAYPAFRVGVHPGRLWCGLEDLDVVGGEHCVEGLGELGVPVPDQVLERLGLFAGVEEEVPGLLGDPDAGGVGGDTE